MFNIDSMAIKQKDNIGKRKDKKKKRDVGDTREL